MTSTNIARVSASPHFGTMVTVRSETRHTDALLCFGSSAKYADAETGSLHFDNRLYAPFIGRFASRDPFMETGGWNPYAFVENAPSHKYDYLGLLSVEQVKPHLGDTYLFAVNWMEQHGHAFQAAELSGIDYLGGQKFAKYKCTISNPQQAAAAAREALREWAKAGLGSDHYFPDVAAAYARTLGPDGPTIMGKTFNFMHMFHRDLSPHHDGLTSTHVVQAYFHVFVGTFSQMGPFPLNPFTIDRIGHSRYNECVNCDQSHHFAAYFRAGFQDDPLYPLLYHTGDWPRAMNPPDYDLGVLAYGLGQQYSIHSNFMGGTIIQQLNAGVIPIVP